MMKIGAILPHLLQFGGVQRFLEIGNAMIDRGIDYRIFSRKGTHCDWFDYHGSIQDWSKIEADCILIGDPPSFRVLRYLRARIYIYVIAGGNRFIPMYQTVYGKYPFILNNRVFKQYFPKAPLVEGGVNTHRFVPKKETAITDKIRVLYYSSAREIKGAKNIAHSLRGIPRVQLIGLSGLRGKALVQAYHKGDFFVSWELREGWGNMAAEALACGLTVVTNGINCEAFRDRVIVVNDLRKFFSDSHNRKIRKHHSMEDFSWEMIVDKLLKIFAQPYHAKPHAHHHVHHAHKHHHHKH